MVHIRNVREGNLLIHKEIGITLVVKVIKDLQDQSKSIIYGMDYDNKIYSGPCEDWFYIWNKVVTPK